MIGLDVMGRNLSLNRADHGFSVADYDKDPGKVEALNQESEAQTLVNGGLEATTSQDKSQHDGLKSTPGVTASSKEGEYERDGTGRVTTESRTIEEHGGRNHDRSKKS